MSNNNHGHKFSGTSRPPFALRFGALAGVALWGGAVAPAFAFNAGDLLVSSSFYGGNNATVTIGQTLPGSGTKTAVANGSYPNVFNNATVDGSFGVTSDIYLSEITTGGATVKSQDLTSLTGISTSFSSKSELALNLSTDGTSVTLMGYQAPGNTLDVSNSNTPGHVDPTNPVASSYQRTVVQVNLDGSTRTTDVNAYSGNNGRAAILANNVNGSAGVNNYYMVGNAGNGSGTPPDSIVSNTGVQMTTPGGSANTTVVGQHQGTVGASTGSQYGFSIVQTGVAADKSGKDDNFRGETIFNNTLYVTKGSGSNGVNTIYQVGAAGHLPTAADASSTQIAILPGFNTIGAKTATTGPNPFGLWFANSHTLYVADEGDGTAADAATSAYAGLEKWVLNDTDHQWHLEYTLQNGLQLGQNYSVTGGLNADGSVNPNGTGYSYTTATDGLRNITGVVNADGTVTIYGVTSTVSSSGDQGADPNKLVGITDTLAWATATQSAGESFSTQQTAAYGQVLRGVSAVPTPIPAALPIVASGLAAAAGFVRRRKQA